MPPRTSPPPVRIIDGKKTFIPLENNPSTLSHLAQLLHITGLTFHDVLSVYTPDLIAPIPRPAHALIFTAPSSVHDAIYAPKTTPRPSGTDADAPSRSTSPAFPLSGPDAPVLWFPQTIGHACGFMALLHSVAASSRGTAHVGPESPLRPILDRARDAEPAERAAALYASAEIEAAHMSAAAAGDTSPPDPSEPNGNHFICFVKGDDGRLWELEGGNPGGPVDRGMLAEDEDVLSERAVRLGPGRFLEKGAEMGIEQFSCVAAVEEEVAAAWGVGIE